MKEYHDICAKHETAEKFEEIKQETANILGRKLTKVSDDEVLRVLIALWEETGENKRQEIVKKVLGK